MKEFTAAQEKSIVSGVQYGREMLRKRGLSPIVFLEHFAEVGGIQIPGELVGTVVKRKVKVLALAMLDGKDDPLLSATVTSEGVRSAAREALRALGETQWVGTSLGTEVVGFELIYREHARDLALCEEWLAKSDGRIGPSVWPADAIVVLPPFFDGCEFAPVFEHQARVVAAEANRVPDMEVGHMLELVKKVRGTLLS